MTQRGFRPLTERPNAAMFGDRQAAQIAIEAVQKDYFTVGMSFSMESFPAPH
jgi:hypothetical protein